MNAATIGTLFAVLAVAMTATAHPAAYAEHADDPTVRTPEGSGVPGCEAEDTCFMPSTIEVGPGTTVTWENNDIVAHTVTSGSLADGGPDGTFDSGLALGGTTFEHTFEEVGAYPYFCIVHPWMSGVVMVTEEDDHEGEDGHGHDRDMMDNQDMTDPMMLDQMAEEMSRMTAEGETMTLPGGEVMVGVAAFGDPTPGEPLMFALSFMDSEGEMTEHVNYDVFVRQGNTVVYQEEGAHAHQTDEPATVMTRPLETDEPIDVEVTFQGFGLPGTPMESRTGPTGEMVEFEQVPEFGTVAVMVLVAAIVSIVAVTSRSGILQRV